MVETVNHLWNDGQLRAYTIPGGTTNIEIKNSSGTSVGKTTANVRGEWAQSFSLSPGSYTTTYTGQFYPVGQGRGGGFVRSASLQTVSFTIAASTEPDPLKGGKGDMGEKGDAGEEGEKGEMGEKGANGEAGTQGEKGDTGNRGDEGGVGERGAVGVTGETGLIGLTGATGDTGAAGDTGATGATGPTGAIGDSWGYLNVDDFANLQAAIDAANSAGGGTVLINGIIELTQSINMEDMRGVYLRGTGISNTSLTALTGSFLRFNMDATHDNEPCISLLGAQGCGFVSIGIETRGSDSFFPSVGLLLGRTSSAIAGRHWISNVIITGYYQHANVAILGSEVNQFYGVNIRNWHAGGHNLTINNYNVYNLTSPFSAVLEDHNSTSDIMFSQCTTGVYGHTGTECNIIIGSAARNVHIWGHYASNKATDDTDPSTGGLAFLLFDYVDTAYAANSFDMRARGIHIRDSLLETWGAKNGVLFNHHVSGFFMDGVRISAEEAVIKFYRSDADATSLTVLFAYDIFIRNSDMLAAAGNYVWDEGGEQPAIYSYNTHLVTSEIDLRRNDNESIPPAATTKDILVEQGVPSNWQRNTIYVRRRDRVDVTGAGTPVNKIIAFDDSNNAIMREYWGEGTAARPIVLNWKSRDATSLIDEVDGDIVIHTNPTTNDVYFAYLDGAVWRKALLSGTQLNENDYNISTNTGDIVLTPGGEVVIIGDVTINGHLISTDSAGFIFNSSVSIMGDLYLNGFLLTTDSGGWVFSDSIQVANDLIVSGNIGINEAAPTSLLHVTGLFVYANNAAARAGGLTTGAFYRTGNDPDLVCVVHDP